MLKPILKDIHNFRVHIVSRKEIKPSRNEAFLKKLPLFKKLGVKVDGQVPTRGQCMRAILSTAGQLRTVVFFPT